MVELITDIWFRSGLSLREIAFAPAEVEDLVSGLRTFVSGTISCGRWIPAAGNDFDRVVVRHYAGSG